MRYFIIVIIAMVLMTVSGVSQNWQQVPHTYYNRHTAVVRAEYMKCVNATAYRFTIALTDSNRGSIGISAAPDDTFNVGEEILGDSLGRAFVDSFTYGEINLYISQVIGEFVVGDSIEGLDSSARDLILSLSLTSLVDAQIYIPVCGAEKASMIWEVEDFVPDSIYINMRYGSGWNLDANETVYYDETFIDSSLYWYKDEEIGVIDLTSGIFPAPYLVLDIYGTWANCFYGTLELRLMVEFKRE
jgi:hypothetical protein